MTWLFWLFKNIIGFMLWLSLLLWLTFRLGYLGLLVHFKTWLSCIIGLLTMVVICISWLVALYIGYLIKMAHFDFWLSFGYGSISTFWLVTNDGYLNFMTHFFQ
jgi:hypothetical protein